MFAKTIIDSDAFLDMPLSTQSLYFHLSMRADDDGFVNNPKKISRMIGCGEDDLKLLIGKRFLLYFESGVVVIKHWLIHNTIRKDRKIPTNYQDEFKQLDEKDNGSYRKTNDTNALDRVDVTPQPNGNQVATSCQHSVVEFSVLESSVVKDSVIKTSPPSVSESELKSNFEKLWILYPKKRGKQLAYKHYKKYIKEGTTNKGIQDGITSYKKEIAIKNTDKQYIRSGGNWFRDKGWEDEHDHTPPPKVFNRKQSAHQEILPSWAKEDKASQPAVETENPTVLLSDEELRKRLDDTLKGGL